MSKKYLIVLQFPANSNTDYDRVIKLEDILVQKLGSLADVDGHDGGSGEMDIFIFADDPKKAFSRIESMVHSHKIFENFVAAYRESTGEDYMILWPINYKKPFKIA